MISYVYNVHYIYIYVYARIYIYICAYIYIYREIYAYISIYLYVYIHMKLEAFCVAHEDRTRRPSPHIYIYIDIYIHICRERERERERERSVATPASGKTTLADHLQVFLELFQTTVRLLCRVMRGSLFGLALKSCISLAPKNWLTLNNWIIHRSLRSESAPKK